LKGLLKEGNKSNRFLLQESQILGDESVCGVMSLWRGCVEKEKRRTLYSLKHKKKRGGGIWQLNHKPQRVGGNTSYL